jgi:GNAT superfamily N-acetyltransferase
MVVRFVLIFHHTTTEVLPWICKIKGKVLPLYQVKTILNFLKMKLFIQMLSERLKVNPLIYPKSTRYSVIHYKKRWIKETGLKTFFRFVNEEFILEFFSVSEDKIELSMIEVLDKGKGKGTFLLNTILDVVDELGLKLRLVPVDYTNFSKSLLKNYRLRNWYKSFGFINLDGNKTPYLTYLPNQILKNVG